MPINVSGESGAACGWLILTRALDAHQWHRYEELARIPVQLIDPSSSKSTGDVEAALLEPLAPIVRVEAKHIRGFMAVSDIQGRPFRVFSVSLAREEAGVTSVAVPLIARSAHWLILLVIVTSGAVVVFATGGMHRQRRKIAWVSAPQNGNVRLPTEAVRLGPSELAVTPISVGFTTAQTRDSLRGRLAASSAIFRYQPQIDLQTGRIAGAEALLCIPGLHGYRPAIQLVADIEAAGLGLALVERRLHDACREQSAWLKVIGHEFPIGVPITQRTLVNAAFLPLLQRVVADNELAPSFLEIQVAEEDLGPSATALRSVTQVRDAGISIAIDGFNAAHSNLRLLSILPISKLRVDPYLLLRIDDGPSQALLFDGIIGAARGLGIVVCVTGITSPQLLSAVLRHGRPLAQGAALGAPLDSAEFLELLRGNSADKAILRPLDFDN
jgi:EAL domain-containing protein (putative c-di-GMP-specific phosphodiesterase class I)